jgi:hypothetical protein
MAFMKTIFGTLVLLAILLVLWLGRDGAWTTTLPAYRDLKPRDPIPDLLKIGDRWPLPDGAHLWFLADKTSYGTILQTRDDCVRVRLSTAGCAWLERDQIRGSWVTKAHNDVRAAGLINNKAALSGGSVSQKQHRTSGAVKAIGRIASGFEQDALISLAQR